jgi:hypothetical protein
LHLLRQRLPQQVRSPAQQRHPTGGEAQPGQLAPRESRGGELAPQRQRHRGAAFLSFIVNHPQSFLSFVEEIGRKACGRPLRALRPGRRW